jgi:membrane-bound serine protease (ClpP class)
MPSLRRPSTYVVREIAEWALLAAVLLTLQHTLRWPLWPVAAALAAKGLGSIVVYHLLLRRSLRRPPLVGAETLIGRVGITRTPLNPRGQIALDGEIWSAISRTGEPIPPRCPVLIAGVRGVVVRVDRIAPTRSPDLRRPLSKP